MPIARIIAAVVLTLAMLYVASTASRGRPEHIVLTDGPYTFDVITVPKITAGQSDWLTITVSPPLSPGHAVVFRTTGAKRGKDTPVSEYFTRPAVPLESESLSYGVEVVAGERGGREYYVFDVIDSSGTTVARFADSDGSPMFVKYIGDVPGIILIPHIVFMFVTVFCVVMAALHAIGLIRGGENAHPMSWWLGLGTLSAVVGGYPFGFGMNWYAFGVIWEGVPFGTDATDNKTQLLVVYFLFVALASMGSLTRGRLGKDLFEVRTLGWLGLSAFAFLLAIYLIPHSIQFSPALTYTVCYTVIGLVVLAYLVALARPRPGRALR